MEDGFWVFGYGSLIWKPGFEPAERQRAVLEGYRRAFCLASIAYRGTPEAPGLVLALERRAEARCRGLALRVAGPGSAAVLERLRIRELVTDAYHEMLLPVALEDGRVVEAFGYVMDPAHPQYRGGLSLDAQASVIATAVGPAGPNRDYLEQTAESLAALGIRDPELDTLVRLVATKAPRP